MAKWRCFSPSLWRKVPSWAGRGERDGCSTRRAVRTHLSTGYRRATTATGSEFSDGSSTGEGPSPSVAMETDDPLTHSDFFGINELTSIQRLFQARVHLGHKTGTWNPLMKPYLFGTRAGTHIIDLDKTQSHLRKALNVAGHIAHRNGIILFVNERSQFERIVQKAARDCGEYFVAPYWRGGTLTNSQMLLGTLRLPDLIIFLSVPPSKTAITEAAMCNIPSIGIVDSDCNPNLITYPIPGNDDTPSAVQLYCDLFTEVISRGKAKRREAQEREKTGHGLVVSSIAEGEEVEEAEVVPETGPETRD